MIKVKVSEFKRNYWKYVKAAKDEVIEITKYGKHLITLYPCNPSKNILA